MLNSTNIPVVEIMDIDGDPIDSAVGISHKRAGRHMAKAILDAGYRKIGFLGTKMPLDHRARKRFEGFTEALAKENIEISDQEFYSGSSALVKGGQMTQEILKRTPNLDFLYYSNDMIGAGGLLSLLKNEKSIPDEIGLAGFNGVELLDGLPMKLATMDACRYEIGKIAAEIISNRVAGHKEYYEKITSLKPKLNLGDTLRS
jgi:LacI family gluconate utilization system Gnt-I transcriptional repressor